MQKLRKTEKRKKKLSSLPTFDSKDFDMQFLLKNEFKHMINLESEVSQKLMNEDLYLKFCAALNPG